MGLTCCCAAAGLKAEQAKLHDPRQHRSGDEKRDLYVQKIIESCVTATVEAVKVFEHRLALTAYVVAVNPPPPEPKSADSAAPAKSQLAGVLVRNDRQLNPYALKSRFAIGSDLQLLSSRDAHTALAALEPSTQLNTSSDVAPLYTGLTILVDQSLAPAADAVTSLPSTPAPHSSPIAVGDYHYAQSGDECPTCRTALVTEAAIEVGHIFYLGKKYSEPMNALIHPAAAPVDGEKKKAAKSGGAAAAPAAPAAAAATKVVADMGCYGIGVSRIMAAVTEASHDRYGMVWPYAIAPYRAVIIPVGVTGSANHQAAIALTDQLQKSVPSLAADQIVIDDRNGITPGAKMMEALMIGYPYLIVVGKHFTASAKYEVQTRVADHRPTPLSKEASAKQPPGVTTELLTFDELTARLKAHSL